MRKTASSLWPLLAATAGGVGGAAYGNSLPGRVEMLSRTEDPSHLWSGSRARQLLDKAMSRTDQGFQNDKLFATGLGGAGGALAGGAAGLVLQHALRKRKARQQAEQAPPQAALTSGNEPVKMSNVGALGLLLAGAGGVVGSMYGRSLPGRLAAMSVPGQAESVKHLVSRSPLRSTIEMLQTINPQFQSAKGLYQGLGGGAGAVAGLGVGAAMTSDDERGKLERIIGILKGQP